MGVWVELQIHSLIILALEKGECSTSHPGRYTPGKKPQYQLLHTTGNFVENPFTKKKKKSFSFSRKCILTITHCWVLTERVRGRSVSIMTRFETKRPRNGGLIPGRSNIFLFSAASGQALGHTKPAYSTDSGRSFPETKRAGARIWMLATFKRPVQLYLYFSMFS
jgi:hypothetical protein